MKTKEKAMLEVTESYEGRHNGEFYAGKSFTVSAFDMTGTRHLLTINKEKAKVYSSMTIAKRSCTIMNKGDNFDLCKYKVVPVL